MSSIELFAGAGGLAMGMTRAGFSHDAVIEWKADACKTISENLSSYQTHKENFILYEGDARNFDFSPYADKVEVISGGPPCQPFSLGGKHKGNLDERDMFPIAVHAVHVTRPKAFIFENVKGLLRASFADYFQYILLQLQYPDEAKRQSEAWETHLKRLQRHVAKGVPPVYDVKFKLLNAADYGVPQKRERVFLVGFRHDLKIDWQFPNATHSEEALLAAKWITGDYWKRHKSTIKSRPAVPTKLVRKVEAIKTRIAANKTLLQPWVTVRDALDGLPNPELKKSKIPNHEFNPGARSYPGHTGSPWDEPAKTLKAGDHGVPGGENMVVNEDGSVRYFTVRESARLQTFPDEYVFHGTWSETMKQLGNAVPVKLAEVVASSVAAKLRTL